MRLNHALHLPAVVVATYPPFTRPHFVYIYNLPAVVVGCKVNENQKRANVWRLV
jgi:hypothetical protein